MQNTRYNNEQGTKKAANSLMMIVFAFNLVIALFLLSAFLPSVF